MKKILTTIIIFILCLCSVGCAGTNECKVDFVQDGKVVSSFSIQKGSLLSSIGDVPSPFQPTDSTLVSEWSYDKETKCEQDMTIETITYTAGLKFLSYYSGITNQKGYEIGAGYEGKAEHIVIPPFYKGLPVLKIAEKAFDGSTEGNHTIRKVTLPDTLVEIGSLAFNCCKALVDLDLPTSVCSFGANAFYEVPLTGTLNISGNNAVVPQRCFQGTKYNKVVIGEGVKELGGHCFTMDYSLQEIILPTSIEKIDAVAFWQQPLERIFYMGTELDWLFVEIDKTIFPENALADSLSSYLEKGANGVRRGTPYKDEHGNRITKVVYPKIYYYSQEKPDGLGNFWHLVNGNPVVW